MSVRGTAERTMRVVCELTNGDAWGDEHFDPVADAIEAAIREAGEPLAAALRCALATMDATAATSGFHQCGIARDLCRNALAEWEAK